MQNIEEKIYKNYEENLEYFRKHHPQVYNRVLALEELLANGTWKQRYELEYKEGYFDVLELDSGVYLYHQNSENFSEEICNQVSYKKSDQVIETKRHYNFDKDVIDFLKKDKDNVYQNFSTTVELYDYYNSNMHRDQDLIYLDKYIFLGVGLGLHIEKIVEKFDLQVILIIEDDIELFRLSMFTTNYAKISNNRDLFFSIKQDYQEFHYTFHSFFTKAFIHNHFIKFTIFSSLYEEKIKVIQNFIATRPEATYNQERLLVKNKKVVKRLQQEYKFINLEKKDEEIFFKDKPVLVVGAGPSLYKNSEWLKENHDRFIIIAAFTAIKTLKRIGVKPDIVAQIDENEKTTHKMLEDIGDLSFLDKTVFMFSASVSDELFEKFDKNSIYLHEDRTIYKNGKSTLVVASVGETIYSLSLIFNAEKIYLLGIDLALGADGKTHTPDHFMSKNIDGKNINSDDFQIDKNIIKIKGNKKSIVDTIPLFAMSVPIINLKTSQYKSKKQTVFNLSEGAFFQETIPAETFECDVLKKLHKEDIYNDLVKIFDKYSSSKFSKDEKAALKNREKFVKEVYELIEAFKNKPHSNSEIFYTNFMNLANVIFHNSYRNELREILEIFFLNTSSYIADFYNTRNLKNMKRHNKKIRNFLIGQLINITKAYEVELDKLLENISQSPKEL